MTQSNYFIDKSSNTFADNLAAFGLAFVVNGIVGDRAKVRLEDVGSAFAIVCEPMMERVWIEQVEYFEGGAFLVTFDKKSQKRVIKGTGLTLAQVGPEGQMVADYDTEKQNFAAFMEWFKALPSGDMKRQAMRGEIEGAPAPHRDWDLFRLVNPAALQAYNGVLFEWWRGQAVFPQMLDILLGMTAQTPNDVEGAEKAWAKLVKEQKWEKSKDATASQFLNPSQGKGVNSLKAEWREPNNIKGFWMLEWLKLVGLRYGGITRQLRGSKDRKTYVLTPRKLDWNLHSGVMSKFRMAMAGSASAVQLDIFAALRYTQALLEHMQEAQGQDLEQEFYGHAANDFVSGMQTAFYKNLGNSSATMNIATIQLPRWVRVTSPETLAQLRGALDEHLSIIRPLDESRGEQFELLCRYRDFVSGNDLRRFFDFTNAYSGFIISQRERRKPVRQFTIENLEVLLMNSDDRERTYSTILNDEGFRKIAYAIRHSTVEPQRRKAKGERPPVEIRYGLGQQLTRKAAYPQEFLAEVMEFLQLYNAENAQVRENKRNPFRKNVSTTDIEGLTALVDRFGSKVVCNMLVAFGYASDFKAKDAEVNQEPTLDAAEEETAEEGEE